MQFRAGCFVATLASAAVLCEPLHAQAAGDPGPRVDAYLREVVNAGDFNGVVLIARGDSVLVSRAYGVADATTGARNTIAMRFRIASITKTFTAAGAAVLAEEGKLRFTDTVSRHVPGLPPAGRITVRQLLLHSAGVPNPQTHPCSRVTLDSLVADIGARPLDFEPGTRSQYSNGGYNVAARVIEAASGMTWAEFLRRRVLEPAGLATTGIDTPDATPSVARGHVPGPRGMEPVACEATWGAIGSGSLVSTAPDLHRWARAVREDRIFNLRELEYPYGWGVRQYHDRRVIEQSGILGGTSSYVAAYVDDDVYVVVLANLQTGMLTNIGIALGGLVFGREPEPLTASPPSGPWTAAELERWVGRFHSPQITTVTLTAEKGALRLRWSDSPETVYIASVSPSRAHNRLDSIGMTLSADGSTITMRWSNGDTFAFQRVRSEGDAIAVAS
jgi:CubicO group peptidase (beta-lactamase class C family)